MVCGRETPRGGGSDLGSFFQPQGHFNPLVGSSGDRGLQGTGTKTKTWMDILSVLVSSHYRESRGKKSLYVYRRIGTRGTTPERSEGVGGY